LKGALFVVTAPSGAGKTTILDAVLEQTDNLEYSISATTRPPRPGEVDGQDYFFLSREDFENKEKEGNFLESARVYDYYYGTPLDYIESELKKGCDIILDIDVQGALSIKSQNYPAVYIYILPPSLQVLRRRLEGRKTDSPEVIEKRLAEAKKEMSYLEKYDYSVINDELDVAIEDIKSIIRAERCRTKRRSGIVRRIVGSPQRPGEETS